MSKYNIIIIVDPSVSPYYSAGIIESPNFFCFRSYPGKISHSNLANRELSNDMSLLEVLSKEVALHTSSHLMPIEA